MQQHAIIITLYWILQNNRFQCKYYYILRAFSTGSFILQRVSLQPLGDPTCGINSLFFPKPSASFNPPPPSLSSSFLDFLYLLLHSLYFLFHFPLLFLRFPLPFPLSFQRLPPPIPLGFLHLPLLRFLVFPPSFHSLVLFGVALPPHSFVFLFSSLFSTITLSFIP